MSAKIADFLTEYPHTIGTDATVAKAKEMMHEYHCHHLPVLEGGKLVGVLSSRDLKLVEITSQGDNIHVETLMTDDPVVVKREEPLKDVLNLMLKEKIGAVIVSSDGDHPWGIFTTTDAMKILADKV